MSWNLQQYLFALRNYAGMMVVPGLGISSEPVPLSSLFVEPQLRQKLLNENLPRTKNEKDQHLQTATHAEAALPVLMGRSRIIVLGEPGQGKSTLLRRYAADLAARDDADRIPILIEGGRKRARIDSPNDFNWIFERMPDGPSAQLNLAGWRTLTDALLDGRAVVLIDAYDEMTLESQCQIRELLDQLGSNDVVISSRPHSYWRSPLGGGFVPYMLIPFDSARMVELATRVCRALAGQFNIECGPSLERVLRVAKGRAANVANNPLLLSFLCLSATLRESQARLSDFPARPAPLIRESIEALSHWHAEHKVWNPWPRSINGEVITAILAPLALQSFTTHSGTIGAADVALLPERDSTIFFDYLLPARFVVKQQENFVFPLEIFREYFAARAIAATRDPYATVKPYLHLPDWQHVIELTAGCLEHLSASWVDVRFPRIARIAVATGGIFLKSVAALNPAPKLAKNVSAQFMKILEPKVSDWLSRWQFRSRHSVEFFITSIFRHHCWFNLKLKRDLRLAARCVGSVEDIPQHLAKRIARSLRFYLLPFSGLRPGVIEAVAEAVQCKSVSRHVLAVTRMFPGDASAAEALGGAVWDAEVRCRLIELAQTGNYKNLRVKAAESLAKAASHPEVVPVLLEWAEREVFDVPHYRRDFDGVHFLGSIGSEPERVEMLLALSQSRSARSRWSASCALAGANSNDDVRKRLLALTEDEVSAVRTAAIKALSSSISAHDEVFRRFIDLTGHDDANVRANATLALTNFVTNRAIQRRLLELTFDRSPEVRIAACLTLSGAASDSDVCERLIELTYDNETSGFSYYPVAAAAARSLAPRVSDERVRNRLLEMTYKGEARYEAIKALADASSDPQVRRRLFRLSLPSLFNPDNYWPSRIKPSAIIALCRGWKGPVSRPMLYYLGRTIYDTEASEAFEPLLQLWEERKRKTIRQPVNW